MTGEWRIAEWFDDDAAVIDPTPYADYRVAKRAAMVRNDRRKRPDVVWVVIAPSGAVCNTGPEAT